MYTKEGILNEIVRTTKENKGSPLGSKAFQTSTGIGWYEWGKYWASWGLALTEAGYEPNKKKTAYDDDYLAIKMIEMITKYGRYPSLSELRIESYSTRFPYEAIKKRKKLTVVTKILEYCTSNKGFQHITTICQPIFEEFSGKESTSDNSTSANCGYVYLIKSTLMHSTVYKVGKTNNLDRRGKELNQPSNDQTLIHSIHTDDPNGVEAYWHRRFQDKQFKNKNEWFVLKSQDILAFKKWKKIF